MQDFQPIPGLAGRIFPVPDPSSRRLRQPTTTFSDHHQSPLPLIKCPRCDSTNTKFCYYNNYNLSQPRHFCKSCRRYWTKGGVLRNVPIGGGCRKNSKKSSSKHSSKPPAATATTIVSGSSSESCSTRADPDPNPNPNPDPLVDVNNFISPETTTAAAAAATTRGGGGGDGDHQQQQPSFNFADPGLFPDPAGFNGSVVDSGSLFDITSSVDPAVYWNQGNWGDDTDPSSLYLP